MKVWTRIISAFQLLFLYCDFNTFQIFITDSRQTQMRLELSGAANANTLGNFRLCWSFFFVYENLLEVRIASFSGQTKYTVTQIIEEKAK